MKDFFYGRICTAQEFLNAEAAKKPIRGTPHRYFTLEEAIVADEIVKIPSTPKNWQTRYPFPLNGQPANATVRRIHTSVVRKCTQCGGWAAPWIDRQRLHAGTHCQQCHADAPLGSYLQHELDRKPKNYFVSNHQGFIANDPDIEEYLPFWQPGTMCHLGSAMGTGKTTMIFNRAYDEPDAITIVLVPRKTLAEGLWNQQKRERASVEAWGLFFGGSSKQYRTMGKYGAIGTIPSLPRMLEAVIRQCREGQPVQIFVDEVDFSMGLLCAEILKWQSLEIKNKIRQIIDDRGIVVAGQTEITATLESAAAELGIDPDQIFGYYNTAPPTGETAQIFLAHCTPGFSNKNEVVAAIIEDVKSVLDKGKNAYVFVDERRTAQIIAREFEGESVLLDRYHRGDEHSHDVIWTRRLRKGNHIFVSSNAVDVGISIEDSNAETIVGMLLNPIFAGSLAGTVQKAMRNRKKPPMRIYILKYQNALPLAPSVAIKMGNAHELQKLEADARETLPKHLIDLTNKRLALESLAEDQPETFQSHHLRIAGWETEIKTHDREQKRPTNYFPHPVTDEMVLHVKDQRKNIRDNEKNIVEVRASRILASKEVMTDAEIRYHGERGKLKPMPTQQLAHEHAYAALLAVGWDGEVDKTEDGDDLPADEAFDLTDAQWETVQLAVGMNLEKVGLWKRGYLGVHYNEWVHTAFEKERAQGESDLIHIPDDRLRAKLLMELLRALPRGIVGGEEIGKALIRACQVRHGNKKIAALVKGGAMGVGVYKGVRFLDLSPNGKPEECHFRFAKNFLERWYPVSISKDGEQYQLVPAPDLERFQKIFGCYLIHVHKVNPDTAENIDLIPTDRIDPQAQVKKTAQQMKAMGKNRAKIARATGMSTGWVSKHTADVQKPDKNAELKARARQMRFDGQSLREIAAALGRGYATVRQWTVS